MIYERFLKISLTLKKQSDVLSKIYKNGLDLVNFVDPYHAIITELIKEVYGEEGYDWWYWFCYENDFGEKDWSKSIDRPVYKINSEGKMEKFDDSKPIFGACDEMGNPICYSFESTWEFLENRYNKEKKDR
jgi:hypothetical protein